MLMRTLLSAFFLNLFLMATALGQGAAGQGAGLATVTCDVAVVYSRMSTESQKLKSLKNRDVVIVVLEVVGVDGTWLVVREPGQRMRLGYVQSECLEWDRPTFSMVRQVAPPAGVHADSSKAETDARTQVARPQGAVTGEIKAEVDRTVEARLSELWRLNQPAEDPVREGVEVNEYGGYFWPFVSGGFARARRVPFLPHGGLSTAFPGPLGTPASRSFPNLLNPHGHGAAFGFQITGGGFSRRR